MGRRHPIRYSDRHIGDGRRFLEAACDAKAERIVSKRINAPYAPGNRGLWQKSKCLSREEFVIVGYTEPEGSRPYLGALLLAPTTDPIVRRHVPPDGGGDRSADHRSISVD
jgi:ATP-dependent DNA ligase